MTTEQLKAIRERANGATPGPWEFESGDRDGPSDKVIWSPTSMVGRDEEDEPYNLVCTLPNDSYGYSHKYYDDGPFLTHARTDVPLLLDEIDRLQALLNEGRQLHEADEKEIMRLREIEWRYKGLCK